MWEEARLAWLVHLPKLERLPADAEARAARSPKRYSTVSETKFSHRPTVALRYRRLD